MSARSILFASALFSSACGCPDHSGRWTISLQGDATGTFDVDVRDPETSPFGNGGVEAFVVGTELVASLFAMPLDDTAWFVVECDGSMADRARPSDPFALDVWSDDVDWADDAGVDEGDPISFCLAGRLDASTGDASGDWQVKNERLDCDSGSTPRLQGRWTGLR